MIDNKAILIPDATYHIYNRANGNEILFAVDENYRFFIEKYKYYISPIADTYCYCLMPNHFHFLIRIKSEKELEKHIKTGSNLTGFQNLSGLLAKHFSNFFNSYSKAINKQQNRKGSLFIRPFKRKRITDEKYMQKLIHYIHYNPVNAGLADRPEEWQHSSFKDIINESRTGFILKDEIISWFDDRENFIYCHRFPPKETGIENI